MIEKLNSVTVDALLESGELTTAQIDMIGDMLSDAITKSGKTKSETISEMTPKIVSTVLDENFHASSSVGIGLSSWGLLAGALGILFVVLIVLNKITGRKKDEEK